MSFNFTPYATAPYNTRDSLYFVSVCLVMFVYACASYSALSTVSSVEAVNGDFSSDRGLNEYGHTQTLFAPQCLMYCPIALIAN